MGNITRYEVFYGDSHRDDWSSIVSSIEEAREEKSRIEKLPRSYGIRNVRIVRVVTSYEEVE